jgi:hypothetical protein
MPTFVAMMIASLVAWLVDPPVRALLGPVASITVSFVVGTVVFCLSKRIVSNIRGGT